MGSRINSSNSDSTTLVTRNNIFQKRKNASIHFNVSNELSSNGIPNIKIDLGSETSGKTKIFTRNMKISEQNAFSVDCENSESVTENEQSVTSSKVKKLFQYNKNQRNFEGFNVSFNESIVNKNQNILSKTAVGADIDSIDLSVSLRKTNHFVKKKGKSPKNNFNVDFEESKNYSVDASSSTSLLLFNKGSKKKNLFHVSYEETEVQTTHKIHTSFVTKSSDESENHSINKSNPFKKRSKKTVNDTFNVEFDESTLNNNTEPSTDTKPIFVNSRKRSSNNFNVSFNNRKVEKKISGSKLNSPFQVSFREDENSETEALPNVSKSKNSRLKKSHEITESQERAFSFSLGEKKNNSKLFRESIAESENLRHESSKILQSVDVSRISKKSNEENLKNAIINKTGKFVNASGASEMCLDQSSFNDENLNNWMSDHTDDEINSPKVPDIGVHISPSTKAIPIASNTILSKNTLNLFDWEEEVNKIISNVKNKNFKELTVLNNKKTTKKINLKTAIKNEKDIYRPPKLTKPAPFATKRLYQYIIKKLEPKYEIDSVIKAEELVLSICDCVKKVTRRKVHQKKLIQNLKKEMALLGIVETTIDFYEFVIKFLPYNFRVKVVPCIQPITNSVFPPKDTLNPFEKIL